MKKIKLLVFHQYLAPYRIDLWNSLNSLFNLKLYFIYENVLEQKFDQTLLRKKLAFDTDFFLTGFQLGVRAIRYGFISVLKKYEPDVVVTYEYSQTTISLIFLKKWLSLNFKHYTMCDDSLDITENCKGFRKLARDYAIKRLDGIITVNHDVSMWYDNYLNRSDFCVTFPIIAKEDTFRTQLQESLSLSDFFVEQYKLEGKQCVFFVGRLVKVKGIDYLIRAFSQVACDFPNAVLVLVGAGEEDCYLKELVNGLSLEEKVIFTGRLDGEYLHSWYNIGQTFVLPSLYEPFGAVVTEALLGGSTVLCSSFAGSSCLINDTNGHIFNPLNKNELSNLLSIELSKNILVPSKITLRPSKMSIDYEVYIQNLYRHIVNRID